ncbi:mannose-1-phosphate guanylyltransferase/mannose-6-phosphate isomerase [Alphaproteobacteria bacterium]|nr:mannose-1-phosphate guanylyltransferase/mannose-6-phosphate isomerase [Alphaproteobacteria bacterium]
MSLNFIILCGGSGVRLWPISTEEKPKQFINFYNNFSLFELTLLRVKKFKLKKKIIIVTNQEYLELVKHSLTKIKLNAKILLEPISKNTTASIYLASKLINKEETAAIMPSDHFIENTNYFHKQLSIILKSDFSKSWCLFGVKPTYPSDSYGYVKIDSSDKNNKDNILMNVLKFIEKPTNQKANLIYNKNNYFWNSGIFFGKSGMIQTSIMTHAKEVAKKCEVAFNTIWTNPEETEYFFSKKKFDKIPSISIDYSVMEKEKDIKILAFNEEWSDIGSWDALIAKKGFLSSDKNILELNSKNNFVKTDKKLVTTIGIKDLIIIENSNGLLIAKKQETQKLQALKQFISSVHKPNSNMQYTEKRPWGNFLNILENDFYKVKKLKINPFKRLSLQYHNFRSEHWIIVKGQAKVYLDGQIKILKKGMSIDIPCKSKHYVENIHKQVLEIIEIQLGSYFGEDDIVRIEDIYGRQ